MIPHLTHVMTLANGIIGVSVLAMPYCFKQCGVVPAIFVLLTSSLLSRLACHFLIKSAVMSRRRNFEILAFHAFGTTGKFLVELFIIGFLLGTCVAFFVVVGDLGPQIVGKLLSKRADDTRTGVLVATALFIVLPLGLLRNIDSLASICTATIGFYLCLVFKVICESAKHVFLGDWYDRVVYWRPSGVLQCLPIFSMALFCQTQLFEIYETIPNACLEKMNQVVRGALNICTVVYLCVGFFGYVAFCNQPFTGNILMSFEPSLTSDMIKMGFVFSVAFSFPLVIFPCRASLNSLLFRRAHTHETTNNYIPEVRFRCLTFTIVALSLIIGILIPNIEFILGIVGSTIGVMICLIFPAAFFIAISTKNTNERLIAQAILFFGMWIMVLSTYANLYAMEESSNLRVPFTTGKPFIDRFNDIPLKEMLKEEFPVEKTNVRAKEAFEGKRNKGPEISSIRREPPIPVERVILTEKPIEGNNPVEGKKTDQAAGSLRSLKPEIVHDIMRNRANDAAPFREEEKDARIVESIANEKVVVPSIKITGNNFAPESLDNSENVARSKNENLIDSDAIKKEELELAVAGEGAGIEAFEVQARHEKLRQTLEKHKLEQLEMLQEQKEILKDIKEQKQEYEKERKRLAREQVAKTDQRKEEGRRDVGGASVEKILLKSNGNAKNAPAEMAKTRINDEAATKIRNRESRGPILGALASTKYSRNDNIQPRDSRGTSDGNAANAEGSLKNSLALPILSRMNNEATSKNVTVEEKNWLPPRGGSNASDDEKNNMAAEREILGNREKRDIDSDTRIDKEEQCEIKEKILRSNKMFIDEKVIGKTKIVKE